MKKRRSKTKGKKSVTHTSRSASVQQSRRSSALHDQKERIRKPELMQPNGASVPQSTAFRIESKPARYWFITGMILVIGFISIYFYVEILLHIRSYYTLLFVVPLYGYIFGDLFLWLWTGVRAVEVESDGVKIVQPGHKLVRHIPIREIGSIRVSSSIEGKTVYILLHGASSKKFLWMEYLTGPRIRIPAGPFDRSEFTEFIQRITHLIPFSQEQ